MSTPPTLHVRWCRNDQAWPEDRIRAAVERIPPGFRQRLTAYRRWQDRQAGILGRRLLDELHRKLLGQDAGPAAPTLDAYRRPYLPAHPDFDFNISHTDGLVACVAAVGGGRVGVDVERKGAVDITEFRRVFTAREYDRLNPLPDPTDEFYRLWTRKEAVMKADGRGFYLDAASIDCLSEAVTIGGRAYAVRPLAVPAGFAAHVAAAGVGEVRVREWRLPG